LQAGQPGADSISEPQRDTAQIPGSQQILFQEATVTWAAGIPAAQVT
jgi:hypothetical protein